MDRAQDEAVARLLPLVYEELHALSRRMQSGRGGSVHATSVVHEAFLRLSQTEALTWQTPAHFRAIAAKAMRHVLSDRARARGAHKRGAGWEQVELEGLGREHDTVDLLALDQALEELRGLDPRGAEVLEMRLLAGMTHAEVAAVVGRSVPTVERDWRAARAWLLRRLG